MAHLAYYNHVRDIVDILYESHVSIIEKVCLELNQSDKKDYLVKKLLDETIKLKPKKDLDAPKKAKTNFMLFADDYRTSVVDKNKDLKLAQVSKELGKIWQNLSEDERNIYNSKAQSEKDRYELEMEEYNNKLHLSSLLQYNKN